MGRNGPPFDKGKPARDKRTTLRGNFDGLAEAMGLTTVQKDGEDGTAGAGGDLAQKDTVVELAIPAPSDKGDRDRKRQARSRGVRTHGSNAEPGTPTRSSVHERERAAQMQAEQDAKDVAEPEKDTISDPTLKETKSAMREGVAKVEMENLKRQEGVVLVAQEKYFDALAHHQKNRRSLTVMAENFTGDLGGPKELKLLRKAWIQARAGHAFTQQAALNARLEGRPKTKEEILDGLQRYKGRSSLDQTELRKRYERMVTVRSVVVGAEEAERQVSTEALNNRDKKSFEKMSDWYMTKVPASVRIFGTSAVLFGGSALLAGNPIGLAALGLVGTSAALRFWAEKTNGPILKSVLTNAARFTSIPGAFGAMSDYGVRRSHRIAGTEEKAVALLAQREDFGNLMNIKNLEHISKERRKALATKETIVRHGRLAGILSSIGAGWLFGHFGPGSDHAPADGGEASTAHDGAELDRTAGSANKVEVAPAPAESSATTAPASGAEAATVTADPHAMPTQPDGLLVGATIHRPGEGFGEMIQEFKQNFHEQLSGIDKPSPALAHVLNTDPNELTHELLVARDGTSLTMQPGDQFVADENQNIWFQPKGGEPQLAFENDPTVPGGFIKHELHGHMQADVVHHDAPAPEVARAVTPEAAATVQEDPSAALNRAQAGGTVISASTGATEAVLFSSSTESLADDAAATGDTQTPSAEQTVSVPSEAPVAPQAPEAAPAAPEQSAAAPSTATEELPPEMRPFINGNEVPVEPAVTHLYSAPDEFAPDGRRLLMYGGGNAADKDFFLRVQQLTREHPGERIYFEAGEPTMYNGIPQKWITSAVYDPQSGFSMGITPESPQMIGRINPQSFTSKLN